MKDHLTAANVRIPYNDDDDWMNSEQTTGWQHSIEREELWIIQRCRRVPVSGNIAYIEQWGFWKSYTTKDERDDALRKLRKDHSWVLRPASYDSLGRLREDLDEDTILAQAEMIKAMRDIRSKT